MRIWFYLLVAIVCGGCRALSPSRVVPETGMAVPARWVAGEPSADAIVDRWWDAFEDPKLSRTVREAIDSNHDLQAAAARILTAAANARIAAADLAPQIGGNFDASRSRQNVDSIPFPTTTPGAPQNGGGVTAFHQNSFGVSLNVSWEIDLWGRIRSEAKAAYAELEAQEADYAARALSLAAQTSKSYLAVTEARLQLELAEATVVSYRETARVATDRVDAGVQSPTDKHLAMANLASAEALAELRRETLHRASRDLEVLLGRYPTGSENGGETLPRLTRPPPAGIPAEIMARRPDLVVAERRVAAADKRIDAARAAFFPRLSLTGGGGTQSSELANLLDGSFGVWTIAGNVMQPIFQGGRLRAQFQGAKGRFREAVETFAQQALVAFGEVEKSLSVEQVLAKRETHLGQSAEAANDASRVAGNRYGQGVDTFLTVLESQRRALDAESAFLAARRARLDNRIDLHLALGGGFPALVSEPQPAHAHEILKE